MLHLFEPAADDFPIVDRTRRNPAVPVFCAVAAGVLSDSFESIPFPGWWAGSLFALALSVACWSLGRRRLASAVLLAACAGLGGCWHHWRWSCVSDNHISAWATDGGRLARVAGKVLQTPLILSVDDSTVPWRPPERTVTLMECRQLVGDTGPLDQKSAGTAESSLPVTGQVRLTVAGRLEGLQIGDLVEVAGDLVRPAEPVNPGELDGRRWMRAQGLHATLAANFPEAVRVVGRERGLLDRLAAARSAVRSRADQLIQTHLRPRTAAVAQSLLLGSRVELDRDLRRAFAESGTLHVLAISGMNVGLLWAWLWLLCRALRISSRVSLLAVLALLPAYAVITDANPPVVRATIVAMVMAFGQLIRRGASRWNSLAIAALLVLAWNPADLFNSGAQLSFVAVGAILVTTGFLRSVRVAVDGDDSLVAGRSAWHSGAAWLFRLIVEGYCVSLGIWVMTSPLIASQFHLVSPIGCLLNVLLSPLVTVMFWLGYSFLLLGMISPALFGWLGVPFDVALAWFVSAVEAAAHLDLGHRYVPAPPSWWLIGFYAATISLAIADHRRGRIYWSSRAALGWCVAGLAVSLGSADASRLSCTVLSVGHGLCVLVECPNGRTLLYDAGSLAGGSRAARAIENALWSAGRSRLDVAVVSHADADHCNGLSELVDVVPPQTLLVHRTCLDWSQSPVAEAIERSAAAGSGIRLAAAGQQIRLDPSVTITVLHPAVDFRSSTDNANSLVLCVEYAGRSILLTGDLERDGLYRLLMSDRRDVDVLVSPHHGSLAANPRDLARWSTPEWVIASSRDEAVGERLAANYGASSQILTTARHGAIRCQIRSDGELRIDPFRNKQ